MKNVINKIPVLSYTRKRERGVKATRPKLQKSRKEGDKDGAHDTKCLVYLNPDRQPSLFQYRAHLSYFKYQDIYIMQKRMGISDILPSGLGVPAVISLIIVLAYSYVCDSDGAPEYSP